MDKVFTTGGELPLLTEERRIVAIDALETWQVDNLMSPEIDDSLESNNICLAAIDSIVTEWLEALSDKQLKQIVKQKSLRGIQLPKKWITVWRLILKEPSLRDSDKAARGGKGLRDYRYFWNVWAEECVNKYLDEMDKTLLKLVDAGYPYQEIGEYMHGRYGDKFWKPRKQKTKTTESQVVNNFLYLKLPTKIVRGELLEICMKIKK